MNQLQKGMTISNLVIQCGGLASVMENSLGPYGRAVLMDRSGSVTITRDGIELLSSLSVGDPVLDMVTRGVIDQSRLCGDGCKRTMLLLRCLLRSLDCYVSPSSHVSESVRRRKMLHIIYFLRKYMLCTIQKKIFEFGIEVHSLHNFEALGEVLSSSAEQFFSTKFSNLIAKTLAQLFKSYVFCQCSSSDDVVRLLENIKANTCIAIVEIYNTPLLKSNVTPGFIITRDFKHLDQSMVLDNVPCILWSIELEETKDTPHNSTIEVSDTESLLESFMMRNNGLAKCLSLLKSISTCVIFSSVYFPDWAVLQCKKYNLSVIDMIDAEEWSFLMTKLRLIPVTCLRDIQTKYIGTINKIEPVTLGNSRFIRLYVLKVHQIILCGPTMSQCKQFSSAFFKLFRYLHHWIRDCLFLFKSLSEEENCGANVSSSEWSLLDSVEDSYYRTAVNSPSESGDVVGGISSYLLTSNPLPLFYSVPHGMYLPLMAKFMVLKDRLGDFDGCRETALSVIVDVLNEVPFLLYRKSRLPQDRYICYNTRFNSFSKKLLDETDCYSFANFMDDLKLDGHESPFVFFKIIDSVFTFAQFILRIESIIPSKIRLPHKIDVDDSDEEEVAQ